MLRFSANALSVLFHPLFIIPYMLILLFRINPYLFSIQDERTKFLQIILVCFLAILFPLIAIFMMKFLGMIESLSMKSKAERIGPLIATGIFYLWLYINIRNNAMIPSAFSFFVLGSTIALFLSFIINIFSKISLHSVGMGGFLCGIMIIKYHFSYDLFTISLGSLGAYNVQTSFLLLITILCTGMVASSRLFLKAHVPSEIYGGLLVGFFSQFIAFRIFF